MPSGALAVRSAAPTRRPVITSTLPDAFIDALLRNPTPPQRVPSVRSADGLSGMCCGRPPDRRDVYAAIRARLAQPVWRGFCSDRFDRVECHTPEKNGPVPGPDNRLAARRRPLRLD